MSGYRNSGPWLPPGEEDVDWHYEASLCCVPTLRDDGKQPCGIQWFEPVPGPDTRDRDDPNPAVRPCPWHRQAAASRSEGREDAGGDPLGLAGMSD